MSIPSIADCRTPIFSLFLSSIRYVRFSITQLCETYYLLRRFFSRAAPTYRGTMRKMLLVTLRTRLAHLTKKSVRYTKRSLIRFDRCLNIGISSISGDLPITFLSALPVDVYNGSSEVVTVSVKRVRLVLRYAQ